MQPDVRTQHMRGPICQRCARSVPPLYPPTPLPLFFYLRFSTKKLQKITPTHEAESSANAAHLVHIPRLNAGPVYECTVHGDIHKLT